ncbi:MAG: tetratricopeptide repeat protein [Cyanobacteria bacterium J06641_5]
MGAGNPKMLLAQANTEDYDYWVQACEMQVALEKYPEALTACDTAIAIDPQDPRVWLERATALLATADYANAVLAYERALRFGGPNSGALAGQCESRVFLEQYPEAITDCNEALKLDREWDHASLARTWYFRGEAEIALNDLDAAASAYRWATQLEPDFAPALAGQCRVSLQRGKFTAALNTCQDALTGNWHDFSPALALASIARAQTSLGQFTAALTSYNQAIALTPDDASLWIEHGALLQQLGRYQEAVASQNWAVSIDPTSALALTSLCTALNRRDRDLGQPEAPPEGTLSALAACNKALQESDNRWGELGPAVAWAERGNALINAGQDEEALASFVRSLALAPNRAETWSDRAVALWNLERFSEALNAAKSALQRDPGLLKAQYNKGRILATLGRDNDAIRAYQQALAGDGRPVDPNERTAVLVNLSALLWRSQAYSEALQRTQEALALQPNSVDALLNQSLSLIALENYDEARETIERLLELAPDRPDALRILAILQQATPAPQPADTGPTTNGPTTNG